MCHSEPSHASFFSSSKMLALLSVLLLSSHVLPLVQSTSCDDKTEYLYDQTCCKKCKPGEYVLENCKYQSATQCATCGNGFFTNDYNSYFNWCPDCRTCTKDHMTYKKNCTTTSNAVCTCVEGYRCTDSDCQACEKIQTATVPSAITTTIPPTHEMHDNMDGSCQHHLTRATLDPASAQRKRRYQCQSRRCVERLKNWRMSEKRAGKRPLMRLWIEYLI
ncbi:tumor necrosis factor receptor superfamily member 5 isoform X2 [Carassius auratus]|uniref:Tumor necrosis factor receptor superfamily member 5 isoform X2 n=1 Tax=Carassius auratus TaxID=7957 RepID=A0A6P6R2Y9_CARAU|nr:tumor necrosis factor receptor superfamily member 5-like isoform X2 [Carassius auratus]